MEQDRPHRRALRRVRRLWDELGIAKWAMVGLVVGGGAFIAWGSSQQDYLQSALLEIGAALILVVPLLFLERLMESRLSRLREASEEKIETVRAEVENVRQGVQEARTQIRELGQATASRIAAMRDDDADAVRAVRDDVTEGNVWNLLHRAQDRETLDRRGVRVRVPGSAFRLRFRAVPAAGTAGGSVAIEVEDRNGDPASAAEEWSPAEPADMALAALVAELQRTGGYPGSFDAEAIFERLADALETVLNLRSAGRKGGPLGRLIEIDGPWAITDRGLEHLTDSRRAISAKRLLSDREAARAALASGDPEADDRLASALETAFEYHRGQDRRAARALLAEEPASAGRG